MRIQRPLLICVLAISSFGCSWIQTASDEGWFHVNTAPDTDINGKPINPELQEQLDRLDVPEDSKFHISAGVASNTDKLTGITSHELDFHVKFAWPRVLPTPCPQCWTDDQGIQHIKPKQ